MGTTNHYDVLLVEDSSSDVELIFHVLRKHSIPARVCVAHDGQEALDLLLPNGGGQLPAVFQQLKLILLDMKLPRVDGFGVLRAVKANRLTCRIPVVVFTSSNLEQDIAAAYALGACSYIDKPMDFGRFAQAVEAVGAYWLAVNCVPPGSVTFGP